MIKMGKTKLNIEKTALGIEFGSTRIKAILIDEHHQSIASGEYEWESYYKDEVWTYDLEAVWAGVQAAYKQLKEEVKEKYEMTLTKVGAIGISAMMHGYLPFDKQYNLLTPFRTWRNTTTQKAAEELTALFQFNIPLRWSIAHLYQAILDWENHVEKIDFFTTLAGYVHWQLTGEKVLGIGDASGMFPVASQTFDYDEGMLKQFSELNVQHYPWKLKSILPRIKKAGEYAGSLTAKGAKLLDPSGELQTNIPFCPPEGDAGTGMVATNTVAEHTGNVSAGTSIFSMIVLDKPLSTFYPEIDIVTTPAGKDVAMVHCNNFTSDINDWLQLFADVFETMGMEVNMGDMFTRLFQEAMHADHDVGKLVSCNYYAGEPITGFETGRPLLVRMPDSKLSLPNFMRMHIYSALATLEIGMEILTKKENVDIDFILGHGGFFKTEKVGQQLMADSLAIPTTVMDTAGEGGPWGGAVLAAYSVNSNKEQSLENYLDKVVFAQEATNTVKPSVEGMESFKQFMENYRSVLEVEKAAIDAFK